MLKSQLLTVYKVWKTQMLLIRNALGVAPRVGIKQGKILPIDVSSDVPYQLLFSSIFNTHTCFCLFDIPKESQKSLAILCGEKTTGVGNG